MGPAREPELVTPFLESRKERRGVGSEIREYGG